VKAIDAALGHRVRSVVGFQSKVGPMAWLSPSTDEVLRRLAAEQVRQVVVVPVAFVSDHVETLYECRILYGAEAARLGIPHYVVTEGLNDHPEFIRSLVSTVSGRLRPLS
jgi:ferrochelatase